MAGFYSGNRKLNDHEQEVNAQCIYEYLKPRGWTIEAISGMLGNMETESYINPGIWQGLDSSNPSNGFGLVQWTPSTKYTSWCSENGLQPDDMYSALKRIEYEMENGLQWIETDAYPMSFSEFKVSTQSPTYLANAFLYNYERPAETPQPKRGEQAEKWFRVLSNLFPPSPAPSEKKKGLSLLLLLTATRRRF